MIGGTVFLAATFFVRKFTSSDHSIRNSGIVLGAFIVISVGVMLTEAYYSPSFRYLNAINPFLSAQNQLTASVAEHFTPTIVDYFIDYSILMMFAGFGIWMAFRKRNDMTIFALILGITGLYVSATFARAACLLLDQHHSSGINGAVRFDQNLYGKGTLPPVLILKIQKRWLEVGKRKGSSVLNRTLLIISQ